MSAWMLLSATVMIILTGLTVDLAGQVHTRQHATDVAAQAARAAGQQLNTPAAIRGDTIRTDPARAVAAAHSYLAAADVTGTVTLHGGTTVTITTHATYTTKFLGIIGINQLHVTGTAQSHTIRAVHGTPR